MEITYINYSLADKLIEMGVHVKNETDSDVTQVTCNAVCFNQKGIAVCCDSVVRSEELRPGEEFDLEFYLFIKLDSNANTKDVSRIVCDIVLSKRIEIDLGTYVMPRAGRPLEMLKHIDTNLIESPLSIRIHRGKDDDDVFVSVITSFTSKTYYGDVYVRLDVIGIEGWSMTSDFLSVYARPGIISFVSPEIVIENWSLKKSKAKITMTLFEEEIYRLEKNI